MQLLFQVHHFPPDVNSTGLLMAQVTADLVVRGHSVTVLTTMPHYEDFRTWPAYRWRLFAREEIDGVRVLRVWSFTSGRKTMGHRLLNYLTFNLMALIRGLASGPSDAILVTNGSFFSGVTARLLSLVKRAPFVYNVQDLYPEVPVRAGQLTNASAIKVLRTVERYMYRAATAISVIAPSFAHYLEGLGIPKDKIALVPNFVDTDFIKPMARENDFGRSNDLVDRFVVSHAGNIGYVYGLDVLVEAAARLTHIENLVVLIVGDGVAKQGLMERAQALKASNVRFLPFQPRSDLPLMRASADVHVALYKPGAAAESLPSKVYEIMASGRPLLASAEEGSDLHHLVSSTGCGICIPPDDVDALVAAIQRFLVDTDLRARCGSDGRAAATRDYSRAVAVDSYESMLEGLVNAR